MIKLSFKSQVERITLDESLSLDERMERVFAMREQTTPSDEVERLAHDIDYFSSLIEMLEKDNGPHIHDRDLLQLYVLLAETYVEQKNYRQLGDLAYDVLNLPRDDCTRWEAACETLPRLIDAVGESVYRHALYELYLWFIRLAFKEGHLDEEMKGRVRKFLKLRLLIPDVDELDYRQGLKPDLQKAIATLFTSEELLKIMLRPQIGHLKVDPVEYTWQWEKIYYDVEAKLEDRFANAPRHMGFCFHFWSAKQELLKEEYGIDWHSPSQMNPHVMFD